jgi:hypothetical protein
MVIYGDVKEHPGPPGLLLPVSMVRHGTQGKPTRDNPHLPSRPPPIPSGIAVLGGMDSPGERQAVGTGSVGDSPPVGSGSASLVPASGSEASGAASVGAGASTSPEP